MRFEWDETKATTNKQKHGVSFEEAQTVFFDDNALLYDDPDHSQDEDRFILLGPSARLRLLIVVHCYQETDEIIRIISARKATRREQQEYLIK
ncbi:MAG: BrnT family toxin [bacterium]|nr:BrnT family toxin [Myxococcales bacterium]